MKKYGGFTTNYYILHDDDSQEKNLMVITGIHFYQSDIYVMSFNHMRCLLQ